MLTISENSAVHGVGVVGFASYVPESNSWDQHRDAVYLIRALKHVTHKECDDAYRLNRKSQLDTKNLRQVLEWFGTLAVHIFEVQKPSAPIVLVSIPDSGCVVCRSQKPRTTRLAEAIAARTTITSVVSDSLRWKRSLQPSHRGGSRDPEHLLRELELVRIPPVGAIVLVDDVLTTGAHILASAARLRSVGLRCENAICVARTEALSQRHTFGIRQTILLRASRAAVSERNNESGPNI